MVSTQPALCTSRRNVLLLPSPASVCLLIWYLLGLLAGLCVVGWVAPYTIENTTFCNFIPGQVCCCVQYRHMPFSPRSHSFHLSLSLSLTHTHTHTISLSWTLLDGCRGRARMGYVQRSSLLAPWGDGYSPQSRKHHAQLHGHLLPLAACCLLLNTRVLLSEWATPNIANILNELLA